MIYDLIMQEMADRHLYLHSTYGPFYVASYAMHHFNLENRERVDPETRNPTGPYWIGGKIPDSRYNTLMIAPSGYMKTTYLETMEDIVGTAGRKLIQKSTMTEAAFIGTVKDVNGSDTKKQGIAETHKFDIVMVGEFTAITQAMKASYNLTFAPQLLDVLDHGNVTKDLGGGGIKYVTRMTLWAGVQPSHYELSSGLGRRLCPMIFLPTREDDHALQDLKEKRAGMRKDFEHSKKVISTIAEWLESFTTIKEVRFPSEVYALHKELNLFQFESEYFDRLLLGYHLAKYGASEIVNVKIDNESLRLLNIQKEWRSVIYEGIDSVMILKIIKSILKKTDEGWLTSRKEIAKECEMVSWNKRDVYKKLKELVEDGHIIQVGEVIKWVGIPQ